LCVYDIKKLGLDSRGNDSRLMEGEEWIKLSSNNIIGVLRPNYFCVKKKMKIVELKVASPSKSILAIC